MNWVISGTDPGEERQEEGASGERREEAPSGFWGPDEALINLGWIFFADVLKETA